MFDFRYYYKDELIANSWVYNDCKPNHMECVLATTLVKYLPKETKQINIPSKKISFDNENVISIKSVTDKSHIGFINNENIKGYICYTGSKSFNCLVGSKTDIICNSYYRLTDDGENIKSVKEAIELLRTHGKADHFEVFETRSQLYEWLAKPIG